MLENKMMDVANVSLYKKDYMQKGEYFFETTQGDIKNNEHAIRIFLHQAKARGVEKIVLRVDNFPISLENGHNTGIQQKMYHSTSSLSLFLKFCFQFEMAAEIYFEDIKKLVQFNPNKEIYIENKGKLRSSRMINVFSNSVCTPPKSDTYIFGDIERFNFPSVFPKIDSLTNMCQDDFLMLYNNIDDRKVKIPLKRTNDFITTMNYLYVMFIVACYEKGIVFNTYHLREDNYNFDVVNHVSEIDLGSPKIKPQKMVVLHYN